MVGVRRRLGRLAGAVAAVVALAGCIPEYTGAEAGPKVGIVGDSITAFTVDAFHARLAGTHRVSVSGRGGHTLADELPIALEYNDTDPDAAVVELGANDAFQAVGAADAPPPPAEHVDATLETSAEHLRDLLAALDAAECVVVVDLGTVTLHTAYSEWTTRWNREVLPEVAEEDGRVRIAGWDAAMKAHYARPEPKEPLTIDFIHPTAAGQAMLADVVGDEVEACTGADRA